jgi:hypothetical protein
MSSYEAGRQLGYAAAPLILLGIAAYVGWRMGKKQQPPKFVIWPGAATAVVVALGMIGMLAMKLR